MKLYAVSIDDDTGLPVIEGFEVLKEINGGYVIDDGYSRILVGKDLKHDDYDDFYLSLEDAQREAKNIIEDELNELAAHASVFEKELTKYGTSVVHPDSESRPRHCNAKPDLLSQGAGI